MERRGRRLGGDRSSTAPHPFRILIGGDDRPDERLLAHARDIFIAPEKLVGQVNDLLRKQAQDLPDWTNEIRGLHLDDVALLWPDEPDGGIIYLDGMRAVEFARGNGDAFAALGYLDEAAETLRASEC